MVCPFPIFLTAAIFIAGDAHVLSGRTAALAAQDDPLALVKEIIYDANLDVQKKNKTEVAVPEFQAGIPVIFRVWGLGGKARKFDTLKLIGEEQVFTQTDLEDSSRMDFELVLGLDELEVEATLGFSSFFIIRNTGDYTIKVSGERLRVNGTIYSKNDGTCNATLNSAILEELGDIKIDIEPSGPIHWLLRHVTQFTVDHILPHFKGTINSHIESIVKNKVPKTDFEKTVCKPFVINV